jgi:RimJ/RimL family protein N-acetyltransferase
MWLRAPLESPRLILRNLTEADAGERYLAWMRDPEVLRYLEARLSEHSLESLRGFIESSNSSATHLLLGICLKDGRHIGNIKLGPIHVYHRHAAIGLLVGERDCWGRGYAGEAIARLSRHAFEGLELEKLYAGCYASNLGSLRAFHKAGYAEEAHQKGMWLCDGRREGNVQVGLTRDDWTARQGGE